MKAGPALVRLAALQAGGLAAAGLTAALMEPRLPPSADFLLPRHWGFWLFRPLIALGAAPWAARAVSLFCLGCLALSAALLAASAAPQTKAAWPGLRARGWQVVLGRLAAAAVGLLAGLAAARLACSLFVGVVENAWFLPQSVDWREPLALWLALFFALSMAAAAACRFWVWTLAERLEPSDCRGFAAPAAVLLVGWLTFGSFAAWRWDEARPGLAAAAGFVQSTLRERRVLVLDGRAPRLHRLDLGEPGEIDYSRHNLQAALQYAGAGESVWRLAALRYLYGGETVEMDAEGLRRALALGDRLGDPLASALLLENLRTAPLTDDDRALLEGLADERRWRVGPRAAAELAEAFSRFGREDLAAAWRRRAQDQPGGAAAGLLDGGAGRARPGVIEGALAPWQGVRVALYAASPDGGPDMLGPQRLVASQALPASGRFEFRALSAGDYVLAAAFDEPRSSPRVLPVVSQAPARLSLSRRRGRIDLPTIRVRWKPTAASGR